MEEKKKAAPAELEQGQLEEVKEGSMEPRGVKISEMVFDKISYTLDVAEWKLLLLALEQMHDLDAEAEKQRSELQQKISEALKFCELTNWEVRGRSNVQRCVYRPQWP